MASFLPRPLPEYDLLLACPSGLTRSQLQIDFGSSYDRVPHPDLDLEGAIEKIWEERKQANPSLFTASKFRYGGHKILRAEEKESHHVCLCLGLTDYKTFVGTNLCSKWEAFLNYSEDDVERCKYTASPLGNGAVVETRDNCILVLKRSEHVGEFPGHFVFPGGHSEPWEIGICGHTNSSMDNVAELNTKIAEEMFNGITKEVVEETGVPPSSLSDPLFIGISRRVLNVRPTAFFFMRCSLSSLEVFQFYKHAQHGFESTQLLSSTKDNLPSAARNMPGCHQGGAALYEMMEKVS